jgi:hypothetical protein
MPIQIESRGREVPKPFRRLARKVALTRTLAAHLGRIEMHQPHLLAAGGDDRVTVDLPKDTFG